MNILTLDPDGVGLDFCMRCQEFGHQVKLFLKKDHGERDSTGDGIVEKVTEWEKWMQWADLIVPTHNSTYIDRLDYFRTLNYPIFGPSKQSAQLEINRSYGMSVFKKHGIEVPPYKMFQTLEDAQNYALKSGKRTVFKTLGDEEDKSLSYVGKSPDDMANRIRSWIKKGMKLKGSCMLQDCIDGVELGVSAWTGSKGFLKGFGENVEYKKLMPGNYGPNCYSEDTEVLTDRGWIRFDSVKMTDRIASYDPVINKTFFEHPTKLHWTRYDGEMVHFKNRYVDLLVTPSHQMWCARTKTDKWRLVDASRAPSEFYVLHTAPTALNDVGAFTLPAYSKNKRGPISESKRITAEAWWKFIGLYLSEGYATHDKVFICQNPGIKSDLMGEWLSELPFQVKRHKKGWVIYSVQLSSYVKIFGMSADKYVPQYIKDSSPRQINLFLDAFLLGDGDIHNGRRRFCSGSWHLISDIQELLQRIGSTGVISTDSRTTMTNPINGKRYAAQPVYSVEESKRVKSSVRRKRTVEYHGMIGCVTVPTTHLLVVRRNGRVSICGNTGEMGTVMWYTDKSKLANQVLKPLESFLVGLGHRGDLDVNCIVDDKGKVWPLEFTARLGWPAFWIMTSQHEEPCQWMLDALNGKDTLKYSNDVFTGLVVAQPPFPQNGNRSELIGIPIQGITSENWSNVHLVSAKVGKGFDDGREKELFVSTGTYLACVTGNGSTVSKSTKSAYKIAEQIYVPNAMVRDDIGESLEKDLPKLHSLGFATSISYR